MGQFLVIYEYNENRTFGCIIPLYKYTYKRANLYSNIGKKWVHSQFFGVKEKYWRLNAKKMEDKSLVLKKNLTLYYS